MSRKANARANQVIVELFQQGLSPSQAFAEMKQRKLPVPLHRISYYYGKLRKGDQFVATPTTVVAPATVRPNYSSSDTKILFAKKILDAREVDGDTRIRLVVDFLSGKQG